jgi:hypothetical protein
MRKLISLPTDKPFFEVYANSIETVKLNSIFAQLVSFGTEVGTIYLFFIMKFSEMLPPEKAKLLSIGLAVFFAAFLEYSLRGSLISFIRQILNKRFSGLHKFITVGDLVTVLAFVALSAFLSWQGSKNVIAPKMVGEFQEINYDNVNSFRTNREAVTIDNYKAEKADVESRFQSQISAITNSYNAKIEGKNKEGNKYQQKEKDTGKSYKTRRQKVEQQAQNLKAEQTAEIAQLEANKSKALATAENTKGQKLERTQKEYRDQKSKLDSKNEKNLKKNETQIKVWGLGFGWFSIAALLYLIYALVRIEIVKHGSGIKETPRPSDYFFKQGVFTEAWEAITERVNRFWYGVIHKFASNTRPPLAPDKTNIPFLYDAEGMEQPILKVEFEQTDQPLKISFPPITENVLKQMQGNEAFVKTETKRKIGFQTSNNKNIEKEPIRKSFNENSIADNQRLCTHCSNGYTYRHHKQKYCSDNCRIKAWEVRTGKQLKMKKKK